MAICPQYHLPQLLHPKLLLCRWVHCQLCPLHGSCWLVPPVRVPQGAQTGTAWAKIMMLSWFQTTYFIKGSLRLGRSTKERETWRNEGERKGSIIRPGKPHSWLWSSVEVHSNSWLKCPFSLDEQLPSCHWLCLCSTREIKLPLALSCVAFPPAHLPGPHGEPPNPQI